MNNSNRLRRATSMEELTRQNVSAMEQLERAAELKRTRGEAIADQVAAAIGSWTFILVQSALLALWMVLNVVGWIMRWDPYPFVLLNLVLSFQAAFAGPVILMSENRQMRLADRRDRLDLQINLLAEQENTEMLHLLREICQKLEIGVSGDRKLEALAQPTKPEALARQIDGHAKADAAKKER